MGVYEHARYPFLLEEMRLIEVALKAQKPVLGICLGSQLMAATLGAEVTQGVVKEIGWHKVELSEVGRFGVARGGVVICGLPLAWRCL